MLMVCMCGGEKKTSTQVSYYGVSGYKSSSGLKRKSSLALTSEHRKFNYGLVVMRKLDIHAAYGP